MLPLQRRFDLGPRKHILHNFARPTVRIADDVRRAVVFLGNGTNEDFKSAGTGFLLTFGGMRHLVTCKHVAKALADQPFSIRLSGSERSLTLGLDPTEDGSHIFKWLTHEDPTVDAAVMPFDLDLKDTPADAISLPEDFPLTDSLRDEENVGFGSTCYAVGLFRVHPGKKRNLPVVHTGNIALMPSPDELVPVRDKITGIVTEMEAYLVEMTNLDGLSGAPVFVRPELPVSITLENDTIHRAHLNKAYTYILGVWVASWTATPPSGLGVNPVGMGVVTPIEKVLDILNSKEAWLARSEFLTVARERNAAQTDTGPGGS